MSHLEALLWSILAFVGASVATVVTSTLDARGGYDTSWKRWSVGAVLVALVAAVVAFMLTLALAGTYLALVGVLVFGVGFLLMAVGIVRLLILP